MEEKKPAQKPAAKAAAQPAAKTEQNPDQKAAAATPPDEVQGGAGTPDAPAPVVSPEAAELAKQIIDEHHEEANAGITLAHHPEEGEEGAEGEQEEELPPPPKRYQRSREILTPVEESVSLWLITFTDVMALMLTFFVLLYAMSMVKEEQWAEITGAVNREFGMHFSQADFAGAQDTVEIDKLDYGKALDLGYLDSLLGDLIAENESLEDVTTYLQQDRLIVSLPSALLFEPGQDRVSAQGRKAIFAIGGSLSRIRNKIEIVGHTDPTPVGSVNPKFENNWQLSLSRALKTSSILRDVGYPRPIVVKGFSSARYDELSASMPMEQRLSLARRVDVVILKDDGTKRFFMNMGN